MANTLVSSPGFEAGISSGAFYTARDWSSAEKGGLKGGGVAMDGELG
jgi:hypothetical protein